MAEKVYKAQVNVSVNADMSAAKAEAQKYRDYVEGVLQTVKFGPTASKAFNYLVDEGALRSQEQMLHRITEAYNNYNKAKANPNAATELINQVNAFRGLFGTDALNGAAEIRSAINAATEAAANFGSQIHTIDSSVFENVTNSFNVMIRSMSGAEISNLFDKLSISGDVSDKIRDLEQQLRLMTDAWGEASAASEQYRIAAEEAASGSGLTALREEVSYLQDELENVRAGAQKEFQDFLTGSGISISDLDYDALEKYRELLSDLSDGYITAKEASASFRTSMPNLFDNSNIGTEVIEAFSTKIDDLFIKIESLSVKISEIGSALASGNFTGDVFSSGAANSGIEQFSGLLDSVIDRLNEISEKASVSAGAGKAISDLSNAFGSLKSLSEVDAESLGKISDILYGFARINGMKFSKSAATNLMSLFETIGNIPNTGNFAAVSTIRLNWINDLPESGLGKLVGPLKNLFATLGEIDPSVAANISNLDFTKFKDLDGLNFDTSWLNDIVDIGGRLGNTAESFESVAKALREIASISGGGALRYLSNIGGAQQQAPSSGGGGGGGPVPPIGGGPTVGKLTATVVRDNAGEAERLRQTFETTDEAGGKLVETIQRVKNAEGEWIEQSSRTYSIDTAKQKAESAKEAEKAAKAAEKAAERQEKAEQKAADAAAKAAEKKAKSSAESAALSAPGLKSSIEREIASVQSLIDKYSNNTGLTDQIGLLKDYLSDLQKMSAMLSSEDLDGQLVKGIGASFKETKTDIGAATDEVKKLVAAEKEAESAANQRAAAEAKVAKEAEKAAKLREKENQKNAAALDKNSFLNDATAKQKALSAIDSGISRVIRLQKEYARTEAEGSAEAKSAYSSLSTLSSRYDELYSQVSTGAIGIDVYRQRLSKLDEQAKSVGNTLLETGVKGKTFTEIFAKSLKGFAQYFSATRVVMAAYRSMQQMVRQTIEVNDVMAQLQIVTRASDQQMANFAKTAFETSKAVGKNVTDVVSATTTYARLGYTMDESATMAKLTTMLQGVGDIEAGDAQSAITAIVKAYDKGVDDLEDVMNKLVAVGNGAPISVAELATGMNNAGSALAAAGNSFEESVALMTAANSTIQDAAKASTGLRTITARIRNTKTELDDLGETMTKAEYDSIVQALTNITTADGRSLSVSLTDANGELRSTFDIIKDISEVWDQMDANQQAALAETLAGTRQQNIFYSLVAGFQEAAKAMELMEDSGSALQDAYSVYMDTISAHIEQFKTAFAELSVDFFDSGIINGVIDLGRYLIEAVDGVVKLTNNLGGLKTILLGIVGVVATIKANSIEKLFDSIIERASNMSAVFRDTFDSAIIAGASKSRAALLGLDGALGSAAVSATELQMAIGGAFAIATALMALYSYGEKLRNSRIADNNDLISSGKSAVEEAAKLKELHDAYVQAVKDYDDSAASKAALADAAKDLANALGDEKVTVDNLADSYRDLTESQMRAALIEARAAKNAAASNIVKSGFIDEAILGEVGTSFNPIYEYMPSVSPDATPIEWAEAVAEAYDKMVEEAYESDESFTELSSTIKEMKPFVESYRKAVSDLADAESWYNDVVSSRPEIDEQKNTIKDAANKSAIGLWAKETKDSINNLWSSEDFSSVRQQIEELAKTAGGITDTKIKELANSNKDLNDILGKAGMSARFLAEIFEKESLNSGSGLELVTDEAMRLNRALNNTASAYAQVDEARAKFSADSASEVDDNFKSMADAYKKLQEELDAGRQGNMFWSAAEYIFGDDMLNRLNYNIDAIKAAMGDAGDLFGDAESAGFGFLDKLYALSEGGVVKANDGSILAEIEKLSDGSYNFDVDLNSIDDLAKKMNVSKEAILASMQALSMWGDVSYFDIDNVLNVMKEIGMASDEFSGTAINIDLLNSQLQALGYHGKALHDVREAITGMSGVTLINTSDDAATLVDNLTQLGIAAENAGKIQIDADAFGSLVTSLSIGKQDADAMVEGLKQIGAVFTDAQGNSIDIEFNEEDLNPVVTYHKDSTEVDSYDPPNYHRTVTYAFDAPSYPFFAKGTKSAPGGPSLVGEEGEELVYTKDGYAYFVGQNGPEIVNLNKGDGVLTADETKQVKRGRNIKGRIPAAVAGYSAEYGGSSKTTIAGLVNTISNAVKDAAKTVAKAGAGTSGTNISKPNTSSNSSKGGGGGGGSSGSSSNKEEEEKFEKIDWIEIAIKRIEREVNKLKGVATDAFKTLQTRLNASKDEIAKITSEIQTQQAAAARYLKEANNVGLSDDLKQKVRNGTIDINSYNQSTRDLISEYQKWYEKSLECADAVDELHRSVASLYQDNFNNIKTDFENQLSLLEYQANSYEHAIDVVQTRGYMQSTKMYSKLHDVTRSNIDIMKKELNDLQTSFSEAMASGEIEEYSEAWYSMKQAIFDVKQQIDDANLSLVEYGNTIREINWEYFDYARDKVSEITDETGFLIDLMSRSELFSENGMITDKGMATLGMRAENFNTYMAQADAYAKEIKQLNEDIAKDPYNTVLLDRRKQLLQSQREYILNAESEKYAIQDLVKNGFDLELKYVQDLIDKYNETLDTAKDLYDYQKKVKSEAADITKIQKQISAYEGDMSEETRATVQKLEIDLTNAQEKLQETEYQQYSADQKKLLSNLYDEYESFLNSKADNIDELIEDTISTVNNNSSSIIDTLRTVSTNVGYTLTDVTSRIWSSGTLSLDGVLATYGNDFSSKLTAINTVLGQIERGVVAMAEHSNSVAVGSITSYSTGGLADFTGLAKLDGTTSRPEIVLNAKDSENFIKLRDMLRKSPNISSGFIPDSILANVSGAQVAETMRMIGAISRAGGMNGGVGDINITIPIDHVIDYNDMVNQMRDDPKFERMLQAMTVNRITGGSSIAKNQYRW